jgi:hypothetical protein
VKRPKLHLCSPKCLFLFSFLKEQAGFVTGRKMNAVSFAFNWCAFSTRQVRVPIRSQ